MSTAIAKTAWMSVPKIGIDFFFLVFYCINFDYKDFTPSWHWFLIEFMFDLLEPIVEQIFKFHVEEELLFIFHVENCVYFFMSFYS